MRVEKAATMSLLMTIINMACGTESPMATIGQQGCSWITGGRFDELKYVDGVCQLTMFKLAIAQKP
jgi:hypothetical protein